MSDKPNFAELTDPNDVADSLCECDGYQGSLSTLAELKPAASGHRSGVGLRRSHGSSPWQVDGVRRR